MPAHPFLQLTLRAPKSSELLREIQPQQCKIRQKNNPEGLLTPSNALGVGSGGIRAGRALLCPALGQTECPHPLPEQRAGLGTSAACLLSHPSSLASGNKPQSKHCLLVRRGWLALCSCLPCAFPGAHDSRERDTEHHRLCGVLGEDSRGLSCREARKE